MNECPGWTSARDKKPPAGKEVLVSDSWYIAIGRYDGKGWTMLRRVTMLYPDVVKYWMDIDNLSELPRK